MPELGLTDHDFAVSTNVHHANVLIPTGLGPMGTFKMGLMVKHLRSTAFNVLEYFNSTHRSHTLVTG